MNEIIALCLGTMTIGFVVIGKVAGFITIRVLWKEAILEFLRVFIMPVLISLYFYLLQNGSIILAPKVIVLT